MDNLFNHAYPYLDEHELNLDWLIAKMKELNIAFEEFKVVNNITFSGAWDITKQYPAWTIVSDNNIGYVSIQPVPVGVVLTNTDYWVEVIDYTAQIAGLQSRVVALENIVGDASSGLVHDVDKLQSDVSAIQDELIEKTATVDIGASIFEDHHGVESGIMHLLYLISNPFGAIHDLLLYWWRKKHEEK